MIRIIYLRMGIMDIMNVPYFSVSNELILEKIQQSTMFSKCSGNEVSVTYVNEVGHEAFPCLDRLKNEK